ncbi:MAG: DUF2207 domain-containing protein [Thermomicrobiales bacterium]
MVLTLLKPDAPLQPFERALLAALFPQTWRHAQVRLPLDDPTGLREALRRVEALLYGELVQRGHYRTPPDTRETWRYAGIGLWPLAVIVLLGGVVAVSSITWVLLASIVLVAVGLAVFVVSRHMPQKTRAGAEAAARWKAFRATWKQSTAWARAMAAKAASSATCPTRSPSASSSPGSMPLPAAPRRLQAGARRSTSTVTGYRTGGGLARRSRCKLWQVPICACQPCRTRRAAERGSLTAASLQSTSGTLFDMFNEVSDAFRPERVFGNMDIDGGDIALRVGLEVLDLALSGGKGWAAERRRRWRVFVMGGEGFNGG